MNVRWARQLLSALAASGADDIVASPGSRSTPLLLAAIELGLPLHPVIDERSAAFFAVGRAKVTGRPPLLICTSGTAGAHYYPALIEAEMARVPVIAITADRPPELQDCAAPQTIDQARLFGHHVRWSTELGPADASPASERAVRRKAAQAIAASLGPTPGPVHINVAARLPLERSAGDDGPAAPPPTRFWPATLRAPQDAIAAAASLCGRARRGLIVAGPAPIASRSARAAVQRAAATLGFAMWREATSQLRFCGRGAGEGHGFLGVAAERGELPPADVLIELGAPPTSAAYPAYRAGCAGAARIVIAADGWPDPSSDADAIVVGETADTLSRIADAVGERAIDPEWMAAIAAADARARAAVEASADDEEQMVRAALAGLPGGALLAVGNSRPVRTIDRVPPGDIDIDVWSQRGANGIDGLVSGAAGAASAGDRATALIVGDVSFAHDIGGLAVARNARAPLTIVVIDNGGGRIFDELPIARQLGDSPRFADLWLTPPRLDLERAAAAYGIRFERASAPGALAEAVHRASRQPGCTVISAEILSAQRRRT